MYDDRETLFPNDLKLSTTTVNAENKRGLVKRIRSLNLSIPSIPPRVEKTYVSDLAESFNTRVQRNLRSRYYVSSQFQNRLLCEWLTRSCNQAFSIKRFPFAIGSRKKRIKDVAPRYFPFDELSLSRLPR